jgi:hypothetical protein
VLLGVTRTLQQQLLDVAPELGSWVEVANLQSDDQTAAPKEKVILFLYAVRENPYLRNLPPEQLADGRYRQPPLALTLGYLVTYNSPKATEGQPRLALVLRAFHTKPRLGAADLDSSIVGQVESLSVRLRSMAPEELNQVWTALNVGLRPSLFYDVDVALIEPFETAPLTEPVRERELRYQQAGT